MSFILLIAKLHSIIPAVFSVTQSFRYNMKHFLLLSVLKTAVLLHFCGNLDILTFKSLG